MKAVLLGLLGVFLLTGCFKSEPPLCSDEESISLVKEIFEKNIKENYSSTESLLGMLLKNNKSLLPKKIVKVKDSLPQSYDENIKRRSCKATAVFDTGDEAEIKYTVQLDEKNTDQFYVELDFSFLQAIVQKNMMKNLMKLK